VVLVTIGLIVTQSKRGKMGKQRQLSIAELQDEANTKIFYEALNSLEFLANHGFISDQTAMNSYLKLGDFLRKNKMKLLALMHETALSREKINWYDEYKDVIKSLNLSNENEFLEILKQC
jgi:hypothetical protein